MLKDEDGAESTKLRTIWTGEGLCGSASVGSKTVHRTSAVHTWCTMLQMSGTEDAGCASGAA